jgi:hypothetical protein
MLLQPPIYRTTASPSAFSEATPLNNLSVRFRRSGARSVPGLTGKVATKLPFA